ncbi:hypothetical protein B296_00033392 [Ensete ventricosum]|uniref:BHLH domain-containing protein n=1 Tax=Ensete ventricosum TaxID=4639 RepID=A0A426ZBM3_ENSVE|nr:hypothetical protein B296_00033392 [Ensete ventricosum]
MRFSGSYWWFISWSRWHAAPETKLLMEAAEQCDDELFGKREGSSSRKAEWAIKVDGMGSCSDQRPNTPRSKHSATEHRRRTKINDRQVCGTVLLAVYSKLSTICSLSLFESFTSVHEDPVSTKSSNHSMKGSSSERPSQRPKRGRMDNS